MSHYAVHAEIEEGLASPLARRSVLRLMPDDLGNDPEILEEWYGSQTKQIAEMLLKKYNGDIKLAFVESVEKLVSLANENGLEWLIDEYKAFQKELDEELAIPLEEWRNDIDIWDDPAVVNGLWDQD